MNNITPQKYNSGARSLRGRSSATANAPQRCAICL